MLSRKAWEHAGNGDFISETHSAGGQTTLEALHELGQILSEAFFFFFFLQGGAGSHYAADFPRTETHISL